MRGHARRASKQCRTTAPTSAGAWQVPSNAYRPPGQRKACRAQRLSVLTTSNLRRRLLSLRRVRGRAAGSTLMTNASDLKHWLVLLYHVVFDVVPEGMNVVLSNNTPTELMRQLTWLKTNFDVVDIDSWISLDDRRGKIAITFDDGYRSGFNETVPMLEALNIEAAFFVNGSMLDGKVFWRDKIRFLIEGGP